MDKKEKIQLADETSLLKIKGLISKLIDADRKISHGDASARISSGWNDELGELELAFDQMTEQKQKSDDQILLLGNALKSINDIIAITDVKFNFLFVNDAFSKTFGYNQEELTGKFIGSVMLEGDDSKVDETTDPVILMEGWKGEQWSRTKDGNNLLVEMSISPVKNLKGEVIAAVAVANDITEKKKQAKELLESKQRLEMLMKSSSTMIYSSDAFGDFDAKYISGNFSSITGYANEDFLKKGWWARNIHPDDAQEVFKNLGKLFQKGNYSHEYRFLFNDESWHWMHDDLKLIKDDSGRPFELIGTWQDITERKLAELKLKESEEKYKTLFKNVPIGIGITDLTGNIVTFNDSLLEPGGYSRDDLIRIGKVENIYYNLSDRETLIPLLKEKGVITQHPVKFKRKDGSPYNTLLTLSIIYINDQRMIQAVVEDITKRKQVEDSLKFFRMMIDRSNDAIEVIDMETAQYIDVNERACIDLGYSRSELLTMKVFDIDPDQTPEIFRSIIDQIQPSNSIIVESLHYRKDGSTFPVEVNVTIVKLEKMYAIAIVRNITEKKIAENKLIRSEERLKQAQQVGHIGNWELDLVTNTGSMSDEMYKIFDLNSSIDVTIETFLETPFSEDREKVRELVMKSMKTSEPVAFDFRIITSNGEIRWIHERSKAEVGDKGNPERIFGTCQDITESKLLELKLKESEARLTDAMKIAKLSTWEYDCILDRFTFTDQSFSLFNTTADHEGGYTMSSEHFAQKYIYPDDRVMIEKEIRKALETTDPDYTSQMEYRVIYAPGEIGYFAANVRIEKDADNRTIKALGVNQDITERKRMEEIVLRINKAVESSGESICMSDPQGHHFYHNKAFTEIFEYTVEEIEAAGGGTIIYVNKDVGQKVFDIIMGGGTWNGEVEMLSKRGRKFNILLRADSIKNENGIIVGLVGIHTDMTERKQTEEALKESEEKYRILAETSPEMIYLIDTKGYITYVNKVASEQFHAPAQELVGKHIKDIFSPDLAKQNLAGFRKVIATKSNIQSEIEMVFPTGKRWVDARLTPVLDKRNNVIGVLGLSYDITERKLAEEEIKLKNAQFLKLNAEKDKFLSIIAHDLRGPLGGLMGLAEIIADDSQNVTTKEKMGMTLGLSNSARNIFTLLENLLEWSQMQRGQIVFKPQMLDLKLVLDESMQTIIDSARNKAVEIAVEIGDEKKIFADVNMLKTIIRNLVTNGIKFTPKGGKVTISVAPGIDNTISLSVKDTGIGMNNEMLDNLFILGAKNQRPGTEGEPSTGLGLLLCKDFIEKHSGKIWVESQEGKGSAFFFTLPYFAEPEEKIVTKNVISLESADNPVKKLKILIAEDDNISEKLISLSIKKLAKEILNVRTGIDAVEACRNNPDLDLVLMDIRMPKMDGLEATRQIRQFNKDVIIIAQTAYAFVGDNEKAIEAGCNDYISKPVNKTLLNELIKKNINK